MTSADLTYSTPPRHEATQPVRDEPPRSHPSARSHRLVTAVFGAVTMVGALAAAAQWVQPVLVSGF